MKRLSVWVAAISFGAMGVSAHRSSPPQPTSDEHKRVIAPPGPKPVGPYSPGIMAGDFLYVSGQGARDRDGRLPETVEAQVRQTLENVKTIVEAAGLTLEHVVYSQVYLASMSSSDDDGAGLARILSETAAGPSRPRRSPDAHRHPGRDQCRRLPRSLPQKAPSSLPAIRRTRQRRPA